MNSLLYLFAPIAVATIYTLWAGYREFMLDRQRTLRKRVAYMLWSAAQNAKGSRTSNPAVPIM